MPYRGLALGAIVVASCSAASWMSVERLASPGSSTQRSNPAWKIATPTLARSRAVLASTPLWASAPASAAAASGKFRPPSFLQLGTAGDDGAPLGGEGSHPVGQLSADVGEGRHQRVVWAEQWVGGEDGRAQGWWQFL